MSAKWFGAPATLGASQIHIAYDVHAPQQICADSIFCTSTDSIRISNRISLGGRRRILLSGFTGLMGILLVFCMQYLGEASDLPTVTRHRDDTLQCNTALTQERRNMYPAFLE